MISPILTYNSEVRGTYAKSDLKPWDSPQIEKTHLQLRGKRYLGVSNKASHVACRVELARFSLIIVINQKIMNYSYFQSKNGCSVVKQIFLMSQGLHHAGKNSYYYYYYYYYHIISMSEYYNFPCFDLTL